MLSTWGSIPLSVAGWASRTGSDTGSSEHSHKPEGNNAQALHPQLLSATNKLKFRIRLKEFQGLWSFHLTLFHGSCQLTTLPQIHGLVMQATDCLKQQTHLIMCRMCPDSPLESQTAESLWRLPEAPCWASEPTNASRGSDHEERAETKKINTFLKKWGTFRHYRQL